MKKILFKIKNNTIIVKEKVKLSSNNKNLLNTNVISADELLFSLEYLISNLKIVSTFLNEITNNYNIDTLVIEKNEFVLPILDIVKNNKNIKNLILNEDSQLTFKICENITKTSIKNVNCYNLQPFMIEFLDKHGIIVESRNEILYLSNFMLKNNLSIFSSMFYKMTLQMDLPLSLQDEEDFEAFCSINKYLRTINVDYVNKSDLEYIIKILRKYNKKNVKIVIHANIENEETITYLHNFNKKKSKRYKIYFRLKYSKEYLQDNILKQTNYNILKTKLLNNNEITYDYDALKDITTLKALGINAHSPEDEASQLEKKFEKGLKRLSDKDVSYVADSIAKRIAGTDTSSFRLAEALVDKASLGLDWRLDAAKDVMDMDAIRNEDNDFDDNWNDVIKFWGKFVQGVKEYNPNSYIVAEITDVADLMMSTTGDTWPNAGNTDIGGKFNGEPDAMVKLFNETGITSEAGYSYFYTDLLKHFSNEFETGSANSYFHDSLKNRFDLLLETRSIDYLRNLYTFMGNHDKPRMIHCLALDMGLFHNTGDKRLHALESMQLLSGAKSIEDMPIEFRLNVDNKDYMRTVSTRAIAMSKLLGQVVNEDLQGIASEEDIKNINQALIDLANGNYLGEGQNINYQTINIKELSSLNNAFETILKMAENHGLNLSNAERSQLIADVVAQANKMDLNGYQVHGDFDWTSLDDATREINYKAGKDILGDKGDYSNYSLYTVQLTKLLKDAYLATKKNSSAKDAIFAGMKDFAEKYDRETVKSHTTELPKYEDAKISMKKNGYASRDFKTAITMAIKQAEFNTGKEIKNKDEIIAAVYKYATEPAVAKASMIMEALAGLCGIPTMYAGDELGMTGYEEKAKNVYLQNRNALNWSEVESDSKIGNYRKEVMASMNGAMAARSDADLHALNDGTPYALDVSINGRTREQVQRRLAEIYRAKDANPSEKEKEALDKEQRELTKSLAKLAYMMHSANGDVTVTLLDSANIEHGNRVDYFAKNKIKNEQDRKKFFAENNIESIDPHNKYVPIQPKSEMDSIVLGSAIALPVGTVFVNANARDKAKYVINEFGNIVRADGGKIVMDGKTSKNGVMILKHIKKIVFKGSQKNKPFYNTQFNFASNPYKKAETTEAGQKLSIMSK